MKLIIEPNNQINCDFIYSQDDFAKNLTNLFINANSGFVLSINSKWGDGKTTFIQQLIRHLKNNEALTPVYFNSFENDHINDPFLSIGATIHKHLKEQQKSNVDDEKYKIQLAHLKSVTKTMSIELVKLTTNYAIQTYTAGLINHKPLINWFIKLFNKSTYDTLAIQAEEKFKSYEQLNTQVSLYKNALESLTKNNEKIIFFIDELDRCRPDYAIHVLEKIKHLFNTKNIIFVLSINKSQLVNTIRNSYGTDNIESEKYLEKFIHIETDLPFDNTDRESFKNLIASFIDKYDLDEYLNNNTINDVYSMIESIGLNGKYQLNGRSLEKIFTLISLCINSVTPDEAHRLIKFFIPAAIIKVVDYTVFKTMKDGEIRNIGHLGANELPSGIYTYLESLYAEEKKSKASNVFLVEKFRDAHKIVSMYNPYKNITKT